MTTTPTIWLDRSVPSYTLSGPGGNDQTGGRGIGLSNGNFLIIWETNIFQDIDGTNRTEIWGEIFDPRGVSISGEIQLAGLPTGTLIDFEKAEIDADDSGGFHMVYVADTTAAPGGESVFVAHFDDNGTQTSLTPRSTIYGDYGSLSIGDTEEVAITVASNGDVIIAEKLELDRPFLPPDFNLLAFTTDGTLTVDIDDSTRNGDEFDFPASIFPDPGSPSINGLIYEAPQVESFRSTSSATIVIVAELENFGDDPRDFTGIVIYNNQIYSALPDYFPDEQFIIDTSSNPDTIADPDVATLDNDPSAPNSDQHGSNSYVVVYRRDAADGSFSDIRAILQSNFTGYVKEFTIKSSATGELSKPQVTHLNGGGFIVAWIDEYAPDQRGVRLQRFDGDGNAVGSQLTFDNPQGRYIWDFDLETMANGRVLLTVSEGEANRGIAYAIYNVDDNHITGTDSGETLTANTGDSILEGLGGNDTLLGLDGDDWMSGGTGTDSFDGGGGIDTVDFTYSNSDWTVNLVTGTAVAGSTVETLADIENVNTGGGDDTITGGNGINILKGNGGDDTIIGGQGADDIDGGSGFDWTDYREEWTGLALAAFGDRTYDLVAGEMRWENVTAQGIGGYTERMVNIENVKGSSYNDTFIANALPNELLGYGGNDTFVASNIGSITIDFLADTYNGGSGIDTADFSNIVLADGHTSGTRSFTFVLSPTGPAAPAGTAREDGGGLIAELFGIEKLRGTAYDDTIDGNDAGNTLNGGNGDDILRGFGGIDILNGGDGDDTLAGGEGIDSFNGGAGSDTVDYSGTASGATFDLAAQEFRGSITESWVSIENVIAGLGNDTIIGGTGANRMAGGDGDDTYYVNNSTDEVIEEFGGGNDHVAASVSYVLSADADVETLTTENLLGTGAINLTGNTLAQTIVGNNGRNVLHDGGAGGLADTLKGFGGNDIYRIYNSGAVIEEAANSGTDTIRTTVSYTLGAGVHVEKLLALAPASTKAIDLIGNQYDQTITGNAGANALAGLAGDDTINGLDGDDIIEGGSGADVIDGGDGGDTLSYAGSAAGVTVTVSKNTYVGGDADGDVVSNIENVTGSSHDDKLVGNGLDNRLDGGDGDDEIRGENGMDDLTGGIGDDRFAYLATAHSAAGFGESDKILDFSQSLGNDDVIDLFSIDAQISNGSGNDAFTFIGVSNFTAEGQIRVTQSGADTVVQVNTEGTDTSEMEIILIGVTATNITAADFIL